MDDREISDTVNMLRDTAQQYHGAQQLRARIAWIIVPILNRFKELEKENKRLRKLLGEES
jgi:cell shape-determining protein MreC